MRQEAFSYDQLLQCGRGRTFGPGNAQLPTPNMLMLDRIVKISDEGGAFGKGEILAELDIHPDLLAFWLPLSRRPGHARSRLGPGTPPGNWWVSFWGWIGNPGRGRALGVGEVKFTAARCCPRPKKSPIRLI